MGTLANLLPNVLTRCGNTWKGYLRRKFLVRTPPAFPKSQISVHTYLRHCKNSVPAAEEAEKKVGGVDREHAIALVGIIAVTTREQLDNLPSSIVELSIGLVEAVKRYLQLLTW